MVTQTITRKVVLASEPRVNRMNEAVKLLNRRGFDIHQKSPWVLSATWQGRTEIGRPRHHYITLAGLLAASDPLDYILGEFGMEVSTWREHNA